MPSPSENCSTQNTKPPLRASCVPYFPPEADPPSEDTTSCKLTAIFIHSFVLSKRRTFPTVRHHLWMNAISLLCSIETQKSTINLRLLRLPLGQKLFNFE